MCYRRVCGSTTGYWSSNNPVLAISFRRCRTTTYTSSVVPCFTNRLLSPRPFESRLVVRLGVICPELRPTQLAIPSGRDTAHAFTVSGSAPSVSLRESHEAFLPISPVHRCSPVDSLRVRWVPLFRSSRRLGAFAMGTPPRVDGFPVRRLLHPIRHLPGSLACRPRSAPSHCPLA